METLTEFTPFPKLPLEIRLAIWRLSLPNRKINAEALLFTYDGTPWAFMERNTNDSADEPDLGGGISIPMLTPTLDNLAEVSPFPVYAFIDDKVESLKFRFRIASVCREARLFVIQWLDSQGRGVGNPHAAALNREFKIEHDCLLVTENKWRDFIDRPMQVMTDSLLSTNQTLNYGPSKIKRIAMPASVFRTSTDEDLTNMITFFPEIDEIFILIDPPKDEAASVVDAATEDTIAVIRQPAPSGLRILPGRYRVSWNNETETFDTHESTGERDARASAGLGECLGVWAYVMRQGRRYQMRLLQGQVNIAMPQPSRVEIVTAFMDPEIPPYF